MSEEEKRIEGINKTEDIVENIIEFNRQQQRQGLKIVTPTKCLVDYQFP